MLKNSMRFRGLGDAPMPIRLNTARLAAYQLDAIAKMVDLVHPRHASWCRRLHGPRPCPDGEEWLHDVPAMAGGASIDPR